MLSIIDCMEVFSKGIHRALVPLDSHMDNISGVELVESASSYQMLTQMDVLRFLKEHAEASTELNGILARTVSEVGAVTERVYAITDHTKVTDAIKCMRIALLNAVPIVCSSTANEDDHKQLVNVCIFIFELITCCSFMRINLTPINLIWQVVSMKVPLHFLELVFSRTFVLYLANTLEYAKAVRHFINKLTKICQFWRHKQHTWLCFCG